MPKFDQGLGGSIKGITSDIHIELVILDHQCLPFILDKVNLLIALVQFLLHASALHVPDCVLLRELCFSLFGPGDAGGCSV